MQVGRVEEYVRWAGALAVLVPLAAIFVGMGRGLRRPRGRTTGGASQMLRIRGFVLIGVPFFGVCYSLWRPVKLALSPAARVAALILGALLYFPGLGLILAGRMALGEMYNVSSGFGVELYAQHRLVTHGPYAYVRHPMYLGLMAAAAGGLAIYRTWTLVFLLAAACVVRVFRGRREEEALAAEFGEQWRDYCRRVPGWFPRVAKTQHKIEVLQVAGGGPG